MRNLYIGHNNLASVCSYLPCKLRSLNVKMATVKSSDLATCVPSHSVRRTHQFC